MSKPEQEELAVDFWDDIQTDPEVETKNEEEEEEVEKSKTPSETVEEEETKNTKEEAEGEESEEEEEPEVEIEEEETVVGSIIKNLGYEFEEEFEDTEEGLQKLVESASDLKAEETINRYFDDYPEVKELLEYKRLGGDSNKFFETRFPSVDYSKVELREDDETQQEQIVRQELKQVRGYSQEEIDAEIEDYRNGGILESKAKRALDALRGKQQKDQKGLLEEQRALDAQRQQQIEEHVKHVSTLIEDSTEIHGFKIPTKNKQEFIDYLFKPVEDGKSQAMIAHEQASIEDKIAIDFLLFRGFDLADIIDRKAKDKQSKTLRSVIGKRKLDKKVEERQPGSDYTEELEMI